MEPESISDELLISRARNGCKISFSSIYRRHQGRVFRFAWQMSGSRATAEEVTQEVFLTLLSELDRFDSSKGSLLPYLVGIARNHTYRQLRRERPFLSLEDEDSTVTEPADPINLLADLTRRESTEALRRAVASLPPAYREVLILCDLEELDYAQAAQALECAIGTVRSRLHRARVLLMSKWQAEQRTNASARCSA